MSAPPDDRRLETPAVDFGVLFNASPNPYMVVDRELRFVAANAAYLSTTARRLEELLGRHILEAFPDDPSNPNNANATRVLESFARVVETGAPDVLAFIPIGSSGFAAASPRSGSGARPTRRSRTVRGASSSCSSTPST